MTQSKPLPQQKPCLSYIKSSTLLIQALYRHYTDIIQTFLSLLWWSFKILEINIWRGKNSKSLLRLKYLHFEKHSWQVTWPKVLAMFLEFWFFYFLCKFRIFWKYSDWQNMIKKRILLVWAHPVEKLHLKPLCHFHLPNLYPDTLSQQSDTLGDPLRAPNQPEMHPG